MSWKHCFHVDTWADVTYKVTWRVNWPVKIERSDWTGEEAEYFSQLRCFLWLSAVILVPIPSWKLQLHLFRIVKVLFLCFAKNCCVATVSFSLSVCGWSLHHSASTCHVHCPRWTTWERAVMCAYVSVCVCCWGGGWQSLDRRSFINTGTLTVNIPSPPSPAPQQARGSVANKARVFSRPVAAAAAATARLETSRSSPRH